MADQRLEASGLALPPVSLGLAALGRPSYLNLGHGYEIDDRSIPGMRHLTHDVLDAAYAFGVRHFDVAKSYGLAEQFLAEWINSRSPAGVVVTSKWGYTYVGNWEIGVHPQETKDLSVAQFRRQAPDTVALFGERLVGLLIHSATIESGVFENAAVLDEMAAIADAGVPIGLSTSGPIQADAVRIAIGMRQSGRVPFSLVQSTWNLLEPSAGSALEEARHAGFTVFVKEAMANGRLTKREVIPDELARVAAKHAVGPDAVCIAAALAQHFEPVVLSGAVTSDQLRENLLATQVTLDADDDAALRSLAQDSVPYWEARSALPWL